jgi:hypothetical protein
MGTVIPTPDAVRAALRALGDTPDAVATNLCERGVHGRCRDPYRCALANYLRRAFGLAFEVDHGEIQWQHGSIDNPETTGEFAARFDEKRYPELILGEG